MTSREDGNLMFDQVEIGRMKLVQTRAILNYIATTYDLCGKHMKERSLYDVVKSYGPDYLVGKRLTRVDIHLLELLYVEELDTSLLNSFLLLKLNQSTVAADSYRTQQNGAQTWGWTGEKGDPVLAKLRRKTEKGGVLHGEQNGCWRIRIK
ncbi:Glutathione S-transferase [Apodemus speciosus]|uniref:glutathione transferase n=1 Tax=Apodemus speciosus TaxID=105296 RepID=A0ABQ0F5T3_APOSI